MKSLDRIVWSEGLLLAPQHLQQLDAYHETRLDERIEAVCGNAWGVVDLEIDRAALSSGHVRIERFRGILPDGTIVVASKEQAQIASRPLEVSQSTQSVEVYLGVARERTQAARSAIERFARRSVELRDAAGEAEPVEALLESPNVVVLFGDERRDDYVTLKVAELVRDETGSFVPSDPFVPPCLRISASPFLVSSVQRVARILVQRRKALAEARRQRDEASIEFGASDVTRFLLLHAVNRALPMLTHASESRDLSPRTLYFTLIQLAGELSTFAKGDDLNLPAFVHTDLRSTFEPLFARITSLLHTTIRDQHVAVQLDAQGNGMFAASLSPTKACDRFFLALHTTEQAHTVADRLPALAKIASSEEIAQLLSSATRGAELEVTYTPPVEIPVKAGCVYFSIATENRYWKSAVREGRLSVYLPPTLVAQRVELLAVPPRAVSASAL